MVSLKERVHNWRKEFPQGTKKELYKVFKDCNNNSLRTYFGSYEPNPCDISNNIYLENLDTVREMTITIQQIKDPVKRAENLARLHQMKLKQIVNKDKKSLKELFNEL